MNKNPKKKLARIEIRVKPKDKDKIKWIAEECNLSVGEYVVERVLDTNREWFLPMSFLISTAKGGYV